MQQIHVAMVLLPDARTPEAIAKAQEAARALGFTPTSSGRASLCFVIDPDRFVDLFGECPEVVGPSKSGEQDAGAPGGHVLEVDLHIPKELAPFVKLITVTPPARRLDA